MVGPEGSHVLSFTREDDWGPCRASCSTCGRLRGSWQTQADAEESHRGKSGDNARAQSQTRPEGVSLKTGLTI